MRQPIRSTIYIICTLTSLSLSFSICNVLMRIITKCNLFKLGVGAGRVPCCQETGGRAPKHLESRPLPLNMEPSGLGQGTWNLTFSETVRLPTRTWWRCHGPSPHSLPPASPAARVGHCRLRKRHLDTLQKANLWLLERGHEGTPTRPKVRQVS